MNEPLQEQFFETDASRLRRWLPWIEITRAFRLAVGLRVLILGMLATILLAAGDYAISWLPFSPHMQQANEHLQLPRAIWPWENRFLPLDVERTGPDGSPIRPHVTLTRIVSDPINVLIESCRYGHVVLWPVTTVIHPASELFSRDLTWSGCALAWSRLLWALIVWSALGVAIVRIVVLEFSHRESPSLRESLKFSGGHLLPALGSVALPSVALVGLYFFCRIGGWLAYVSWLQPLVGFFWLLDLLAGLGIAIILLLMAAGWPLMICTMGVDRGDAFEGFTRAFSYVFGRPWYAMSLLLLTTLYGSLVFVFLVTLVSSGASLAIVAAGGGEGIDTITLMTPPLLRDASEIRTVSEEGVLAATMGGIWLNLWATVCVGFVASFFWSASTIIYLLLRQSVDATPIDEVHGIDPDHTPATLPLSGMAAAELREALRQAEPDQSVLAPSHEEPAANPGSEAGGVSPGDSETSAEQPS